MIRLDILSDPICPWCHIGKAELDRALAEAGDMPFEIAWHPFQLNPGMPPGGMPRADYLTAKFGAEALAGMEQRLLDRAEAAGAVIDFARQTRVPNTLDAHRLIHWAGLEGCQTAVVSALFAAYFTEGRDIGDREVLCDIADAAGMDAAVVARLLASDADAEEIRARDASAREMGVTGVPTFIVDRRHAVPGAQPAALWSQVIAELAGAGAQP